MNLPKGNIQVLIAMDRMGNITMRPVRDKYVEYFVEEAIKQGNPGEETIFFQSGFGAEDVIDELSPVQQKNLNDGWSIKVLMDPWVIGKWYGAIVD